MFFAIAFRGMAQNNNLLNSDWADSVRNAIQDSIKKAKSALPKKIIPVLKPKDSSVFLKRDTTHQKLIVDSTAKTVLSDSIQTAQKTDSIQQARINDSITAVALKAKSDSLSKASAKITKPVAVAKGIQGSERDNGTPDLIFYILVFISFFLALIRSSFSKYFSSIFSLSFQATFRQKQTREQMSQNFFPAFMLNVLFILSCGLFITLLAQFYKYTPIPFWQLFIFSTTILGLVYLVKFFVIYFTGWVFNAPDAAAEYRFIVFLINKLFGVLLIPILFVIAYSNAEVKKIAITVALCLAGLFIALRYLISLARIRRNLHLTAFHFFIYLCAVEIMPLLIIYKVLFIKTGNT